MNYLMGVDGGGSKTYVVISDEQGNRLGTGISGCGNYQGPGIEVAISHIRAAIEGALIQAGLTEKDIAYVQYGLAGADREKDISILNQALSSLPFSSWGLVCDTMEGLRTGSKDNVGVVLVCGSGTNAAGRNPLGQTVQTGGFGHLFGDRTGGNDLARATFGAAIRSWELRETESVLTKKVPRYFGRQSMQDLFDYFLDNDINEVPGQLTLLLHEAADEGDALSIRILENAGMELGLAANSVIKRLGGFADKSIPIVLVGSVVQNGRNAHLLKALEETIVTENRLFEIIIPELVPVYGAIMLAMDHLRIPVTDTIIKKFMEYGGYQK